MQLLVDETGRKHEKDDKVFSSFFLGDLFKMSERLAGSFPKVQGVIQPSTTDEYSSSVVCTGDTARPNY